jgi:hypothetical protein
VTYLLLRTTHSTTKECELLLTECAIQMPIIRKRYLHQKNQNGMQRNIEHKRGRIKKGMYKEKIVLKKKQNVRMNIVKNTNTHT